MLVRRLSEIYISLFSWCCESFSSEPQLVQSQGSVWVMETQSSKLKNVSNNFCPVLTFLNATMSTVILLKSTLLPQLLFPQSFRECPSNLSFLLLCSLSLLSSSQSCITKAQTFGLARASLAQMWKGKSEREAELESSTRGKGRKSQRLIITVLSHNRLFIYLVSKYLLSTY